MSVVVNNMSSVNVVLNLSKHLRLYLSTHLKAGSLCENEGAGAALQHSNFSD